MGAAEFIPFLGGVETGFGMPSLEGPAGQFRDLEALRKAVTAGYGTDMAALVGGGALRLQSIEPTLIATIQEDKHFKLFNKLAQSNATATVDEFTIKDQIGGYPGSGFNDELGVIAESQGHYQRKTALVKYLMTRRQVSVVQESQKVLVDTIALEKVDAARELKTSVEWGGFYGDSAVVPQEFDGIDAQIEALADPDLTIDAGGKGLSYVAQEVLNLAAQVAGAGRFGMSTDYFCSYAVQAAEIDHKLDPAFRVGLGGAGGDAIKIGTPVSGIKSSFGTIQANPDVFIQEGQPPFEARGGTFPALVTAAGLTAVTVCSQTPGAATPTSWKAAHAGLYYWGIEAIGKGGRSTCFVTTQGNVAAGDVVTLVITNPADANVTGYVIHRSRKNGTNAKADLREMRRIPLTAGATTTYVDRNTDVPGTSKLFLLNMTPGANAINLRRLLPMTMFPLFPVNTATRPWAQLLFCYLRMAKPRQHARVKNILPQSAAWQPF